MTAVDRPHRGLCPEADERDAMTEVEFWEHVLGTPPLFEDGDVEIDVAISHEPCPVCGEQGACGYDAEGRSMIHTDEDLDS